MTTILVALSLFISCFETANNFIEVVPPVEVDVVSVQSDGWEYIGVVAVFNSYGSKSGTGKLYVRVMGKRLFYKLVKNGHEYIVASNPDYGKSRANSKDLKYVAGDYYINLPE